MTYNKIIIIFLLLLGISKPSYALENQLGMGLNYNLWHFTPYAEAIDFSGSLFIETEFNTYFSLINMFSVGMYISWENLTIDIKGSYTITPRFYIPNAAGFFIDLGLGINVTTLNDFYLWSIKPTQKKDNWYGSSIVRLGFKIEPYKDNKQHLDIFVQMEYNFANRFMQGFVLGTGFMTTFGSSGERE